MALKIPQQGSRLIVYTSLSSVYLVSLLYVGIEFVLYLFTTVSSLVYQQLFDCILFPIPWESIVGQLSHMFDALKALESLARRATVSYHRIVLVYGIGL